MKHWQGKSRHRPAIRLDSRRPTGDSYAMASGTDLDRLADYVTSRRVELGMSVEDLAQRMGMHPRTVRRIETGNSVKRDTYAVLERIFGWTPGSARRVLEGGRPSLVEPAVRLDIRTDREQKFADALIDMEFEIDLVAKLLDALRAYDRERNAIFLLHPRETGSK